jgi:hypothetical protein
LGLLASGGIAIIVIVLIVPLLAGISRPKFLLVSR